MALTERQQEVRDLLEAGNTAPQIAEKLGVSVNAIYQQIRRMRGGKGKAAKKAGRKSSGKGKARAAAATPAPLPTPSFGTIKPITPVRAVANRRDEIQAEVKESAKALLDANTAARRAKEDHEKIQAKHKDELKRLDAAERALKVARPVKKTAAKPKAKTPATPPANGTAATG